MLSQFYTTYNNVVCTKDNILANTYTLYPYSNFAIQLSLIIIIMIIIIMSLKQHTNKVVQIRNNKN